MLFQPSLNKNLEQVARRAIEFSNKANHKEAQRLRRLTRHAVEKSDKDLERRIEIVFGVAALVGVIAVMIIVKLGWLF